METVEAASFFRMQFAFCIWLETFVPFRANIWPLILSNGIANSAMRASEPRARAAAAWKFSR